MMIIRQTKASSAPNAIKTEIQRSRSVVTIVLSTHIQKLRYGPNLPQENVRAKFNLPTSTQMMM